MSQYLTEIANWGQLNPPNLKYNSDDVQSFTFLCSLLKMQFNRNIIQNNIDHCRPATLAINFFRKLQIQVRGGGVPHPPHPLVLNVVWDLNPRQIG